MYTIKEAAARVRLSVDVLRAWERRYGIVEPRRTNGGYRLYDDAAIARLGAMRELVANGWSPANAAAHLLDPARAVDAASPASEPVASAVAAGATAGLAVGDGSGASGAARRFVAAAAALDQRAVAAAIDDMFAGRSFERSLSDEVYPALRALGQAWARGDVSVAGEHLASHAVLRRLAGAFEGAAVARPDGPLVVVGLPPGSRHELGVLGFATVARRSGLRVTYLGPDLPAADWVAGTDAAAAAVIGVATAEDRAAAEAVAERLAAERPRLVVAIGGPGAADARPGARDRAIELPSDFEAAVALIDREISHSA